MISLQNATEKPCVAITLRLYNKYIYIYVNIHTSNGIIKKIITTPKITQPVSFSIFKSYDNRLVTHVINNFSSMTSIAPNYICALTKFIVTS